MRAVAFRNASSVKGCILAVSAAAVLSSGPAFAWQEPQRGSDLRSELLATIRTVAALELNPPIEFIVGELRHDGNFAFGSLDPQRPGGAAIDWDSTQMAARGEPEDWYDGTTIHVFFKRVEGHWYVEDYSIGATDVWWFQSSLCADYNKIIPEYC